MLWERWGFPYFFRSTYFIRSLYGENSKKVGENYNHFSSLLFPKGYTGPKLEIFQCIEDDFEAFRVKNDEVRVVFIWVRN